MTELADAFGRIEEVARENERLQREVADLRDRLAQQGLGLGQVTAYVELAALLRQYKDRPNNAVESALYEQLARIDRNIWGEAGPTRRQQLQALGKTWVRELKLGG